MVTQCCFCRGKTDLRRITAENWWGGELALVENVPAWVCGSCGERYFDAEVVAALNRMRIEGGPPVRTIRVPVFAFPEARVSEAQEAQEASADRVLVLAGSRGGAGT